MNSENRLQKEKEVALDIAAQAYATGSDDNIEIYPDAKVERVEDGFWVEARVWVPLGDVEEVLPPLSKEG